MNRRVLIDAGPLVALLSHRDQHHARCVQIAAGLPNQLHTSVPVLTEAAYLVQRYGKNPHDILDLVRTEELIVLFLRRDDLLEIDDVVTKYADQGVSVADASLMHLAEREGIAEVFTIDPSDFGAFRTKAGSPLTVLS